MIKKDNNNNIHTNQKKSKMSNDEKKTIFDKNKDINAIFDENQESLYPIIEKVEGLDNYLEYLKKLEYELNKEKYMLKNLIDNSG